MPVLPDSITFTKTPWRYCDACDDVHHESDTITDDFPCGGDEHDPSCWQQLYAIHATT